MMVICRVLEQRHCDSLNTVFWIRHDSAGPRKCILNQEATLLLKGAAITGDYMYENYFFFFFFFFEKGKKRKESNAW
jgi:hypothetical protein